MKKISESLTFAPSMSKDFYSHSYKLRKEASTMTPKTIQWLCSHAPSLTKNITKKPFSVLSIGSGEGDIDLDFIHTLIPLLHASGSSLNYIALEPNPDQRKKFLSRIKDCHFDDPLKITISEKTFEELQTDLNAYDLVLMIQVLYYFKNPDEMIRKARSMIRSGGDLVIIHQTGKGIPEIQRFHMQELKGNTNEMLSSFDIQRLLIKENFPFTLQELDAKIDISTCLQGTAVGLQIMSFCMECDLSSLNKMKFDRLQQSFRDFSVTDKDGASFIYEPIGIFTLPIHSSADKDKDYYQDTVQDYQLLAQSFDWNQLLSYKIEKNPFLKKPLKVLDVACGTGRWFKALSCYLDPKFLSKGDRITYDVLDLSSSSIAEIQARIKKPFHLGTQYISPLQEAQISPNAYDLLWSMHGFYAIPLSDLKPCLQICQRSLSSEGIALISLGTRSSFYHRFYKMYLKCFHEKKETFFCAAEDITNALSDLAIPFQISSIIYEEEIAASDHQALEHYIINESMLNSFSKDEDLQDCEVTLEQLMDHEELGKYLKSLIRGDSYFFPQETFLISFGDLSSIPSSFNNTPSGQRSSKLLSADWLGHGLQPNPTEIKTLTDTVVKHILYQQEHLEEDPLGGSGTNWMYSNAVSDEVKEAAELAQTLLEPLPERGVKDAESVIQDIFKRLAPSCMNDNSAGYLAYIPGGGLYHAVLADFISLSINRYMTMFMAAPGLAAIEEQAVRWLCDIVDYPKNAGGVLTSGGSTANFIATHVARMNKLAVNEISKGTVYVTDQSHYSVKQAVALCGFPLENIRVVPSRKDDYCVCITFLEKMILEDLAKGFKPFLLVGLAGTTSTGAVDDLFSLSQLAKKYDLWFHVDAAYGGFFKLTAKGKLILSHMESADSITLDPHKSMFLPYGTGSFLTRNKKALKGAFCFEGCYIQPSHKSEESPIPDDIMDLSHELSRECRGLRVWLPLKLLGIKAFSEQLEEKLALAEYMTNQLRLIPSIRIVAYPQLSIIAFRLEPSDHDLSPVEIDKINQKLLKEINEQGNILLSPFRNNHLQRGSFCIRIAILSFRTHRDRIDMGLKDIRKAVTTI